MKYLKLIFSILIFVTISLMAAEVIKNSKHNQKYKKDYAELNHFKYGLFSVEAWKKQISTIISDEIDQLYLTRRNEKTLKNHLETQLEILIDKIDERIQKTNQKTTSGKFKQTLIESFVDRDEIKKGVPEYAEAIMKELSSPQTEKQIKGMLKTKINEYLKETFDKLPDNSKTKIVREYKAEDENDAKEKIGQLIKKNHENISEQSFIIAGLAILIFLFEAFSKKPLPPSQYILMTLTLLVLLIVGVTTPMIDMEAKIAHLNFVLFDHPIEFKDQILYFQSKSINDVFWIMIKHKEIQMKFVGILMVSFSIVFPVLKMLSSLAYYYNFCEARKYKIINFFVLKSGKWSMADVLVVAIFMAYIGFNGIINSQLDNLKEAGENLDVLTTNGTNLQPGFYLFFTYTILAMFLASFITKRPYECRKTEDH